MSATKTKTKAKTKQGPGKGKYAGAKAFWTGKIPKRLQTALAVRKRLDARRAAVLKELRKVETFHARIEKAILVHQDAGQAAALTE